MNTDVRVLDAKTVAIVGLSDKADRPSYLVGEYFKSHGYTIIPVNPMVKTALGILTYPSVSAIPASIYIDIVDIFRAPDQVISVIDDIVQSGRKPFVWMQEGVGTPQTKAYAESHGLSVAMDICMMKEHKRVTESRE